MAKKWQPYAIPFSYTHDEVGETQPSVLGMDSEAFLFLFIYLVYFLVVVVDGDIQVTLSLCNLGGNE